jgi:Uma2 family endonuclease
MTMLLDKTEWKYEERKRWTRNECEFLERSGLLPERYELIDGEIISKMGQLAVHNRVIIRIIIFLAAYFGSDRVRSQTTTEVRDDDQITNRPEPDVYVIREGTEDDKTPSGAATLLAVEVAQSTHGSDFRFKAGLYARAGVAEYWAINLPKRTLTVFRSSDAIEGTWADIQTFEEEATVSCQAASEHTTAVRDLLPPPSAF